MASAILSSIIAIVGKVTGCSTSSWPALAGDQYPCHDEVQGDLRHLRRTLLRIQAVLAEAEEREIRDHAVNLWLQELRSLPTSRSSLHICDL
jgi:Rx N-terminal domain